jgi:hypothetical protein
MRRLGGSIWYAVGKIEERKSDPALPKIAWLCRVEPALIQPVSDSLGKGRRVGSQIGSVLPPSKRV